MHKPKLGLSLMPTDDFRQASDELFKGNRIEAIEWSFDITWNGLNLEQWCQDIIDKFSDSGALTGHGVHLSPLSGRFSKRQEKWLSRAREEFERRSYIHATEHFGFSQAGPIGQGAPLAVPMNSESLHKGKEMMKRYADAVQCPVGLENLALAFTMEDVERQGDFIDQLISEVDGFLLLDLHNIYCQLENFCVSEIELLNSYPLSKVRELHLSGGSWSPSISGKRIMVRRDSHDEGVPQEVFNLATLALKICPNVDYVFVERLGNTMLDMESQIEFREDFETLEEILELCFGESSHLEPVHVTVPKDSRSEKPLCRTHRTKASPPEYSPLADYQDALQELFSRGLPHDLMIEALGADPRFEPFQDYVKEFDHDMVGVARELIERWSLKLDEFE